VCIHIKKDKYLTQVSTVSDYIPPESDDSTITETNNHVLLYTLLPIGGVLALSVLVIAHVHKYVKPIPQVASLVRWISRRNLGERQEDDDIGMQVLHPVRLRLDEADNTIEEVSHLTQGSMFCLLCFSAQLSWLAFDPGVKF